MKNFELTPVQIQELKRAHRSAQYARIAYRFNALILLGTGWTLKQVSEALLLDEETLRHYVNRYTRIGIEALSKDDHKGKACSLIDDQIEQLKLFMDQHICLSSAEPIHFVQENFEIIGGISLS